MCTSRSIFDDMMVYLHLLRKTDGLEGACQLNSKRFRQDTQDGSDKHLLCYEQLPLIVLIVLIIHSSDKRLMTLLLTNLLTSQQMEVLLSHYADLKGQLRF